MAPLFKDSLTFAGFIKKIVTVYPNPVAGGTSVTISVRLDEPGLYSAQLFSPSGVLVETVKLEGNEKSKKC